jgi:hypothetical protein
MEGNLFCNGCRTVEKHYMHGVGAVCQICGQEWDDKPLAVTEKWAEGVDSDFMATVIKFNQAGELTEDDKRLYCIECKDNNPHTEVYDVNTSKMGKFKCDVCSHVRYGRFQLDSVTGVVTDLARHQTYRTSDDPNDTATTYAPSYQSYNLGGYHACKHWREVVQIGRYRVSCSASVDRSAATGAEPVPELGIYFSPFSWSTGLTASPNLPKDIKLETSDLYPRILCEWIDMKAPRLSHASKLVKIAADYIRKGRRVDIGCIGGHGRTGTFLALLMIELLGLKAEEAVKRVRSDYCLEAVESYEQRAFVYLWAGEPAPKRIYATTLTTKNWKASNDFKYKSKKEKKAAKKARRRRRREFEDLVQEAALSDVSLETFEEDGSFWRCEECSTVKADGARKIVHLQSVKWWTYCKTCEKYQQHSRPPEMKWLASEKRAQEVLKLETP